MVYRMTGKSFTALIQGASSALRVVLCGIEGKA